MDLPGLVEYGVVAKENIAPYMIQMELMDDLSACYFSLPPSDPSAKTRELLRGLQQPEERSCARQKDVHILRELHHKSMQLVIQLVPSHGTTKME